MQGRKEERGVASRVVGCGVNYGMLASAGAEDKALRIIDLPPGAVRLAASSSAVFALQQDGKIYAWGKFQRSTWNRPTQFELPAQVTVCSIATGEDHVMLLTSAGKVFTFGKGSNGRLGHGNAQSEAAPKEVTFNKRVLKIAAGSAHSLMLTEQGEVYGFGQTLYGQLGLTLRTDQSSPVKLDKIPTQADPIDNIAAGYSQSFAITCKGNVYSFGLFGPWLGHLRNGSDPKISLPGVIGALQDREKVIVVAVGKSHTLFLNDQGQVFVAGAKGDWLGQGTSAKDDVMNPVQITFVSGMRIVAIAAGEKHSLVLRDDGQAFSFGSGSNGRLGHGNTQAQKVPKEMDANNHPVCGICCGPEQSFLLTGSLPLDIAQPISSSKSSKSSSKSKSDKSASYSDFANSTDSISSKSAPIKSPKAIKRSKDSLKKSRKKQSSEEESSDEDSEESEENEKKPAKKEKKSRKPSKSSKASASSDEDEDSEEETESRREKSGKKSKGGSKSGKRKKSELDKRIKDLLVQFDCLEAQPLLIKGKVSYETLQHLSKEDLIQLGVPIGPATAIYNYLQKQQRERAKAQLEESGGVRITIESTDLSFQSKLGSGAFGDVWKGKLRGNTTVAIKTIRSADKSDFMREARIMAYVNCLDRRF